MKRSELESESVQIVQVPSGRLWLVQSMGNGCIISGVYICVVHVSKDIAGNEHDLTFPPQMRGASQGRT